MIKALIAFATCFGLGTVAHAQGSLTAQQALSTVDKFLAGQQSQAGGPKAFLKRNADVFTRDLAQRWLAPEHVDSPDNFLGAGSALYGINSDGFRVQSRRQASDMCMGTCAIEVTVLADTPDARTPKTQMKSIVFLRAEDNGWKVDDVLLYGQRLLKSSLLNQ